jgi:hypothetical protein
MTCLRVETVIRAMRNMHERGEISIRKGKVFMGAAPLATARLCHN